MKLLYVDINVRWWQSGVLGLKGNELIAYAFIWQQTFDPPMEENLDDVSIMYKLGLRTLGEVRKILEALIKDDLIEYDDEDGGYYALRLSNDTRKKIRDEERVED